jgi:hypothetical protein
MICIGCVEIFECMCGSYCDYMQRIESRAYYNDRVVPGGHRFLKTPIVDACHFKINVLSIVINEAHCVSEIRLLQ